MDTTTRIKLPLLVAGQAQKEAWHNESLLLIDRLVGGVVEGPAMTVPPASPTADGLYAIGAGASGAWSGQDGLLGAFTPSGWRFIVPAEGMRLTDRTTGQEWRRTTSGWEIGRTQSHEIYVDGAKVIGARAAPIAGPTGGGTIDIEARAALSAMLAALRGHGLIGT